MIRVVDPAIDEEALDRVTRNLRSALSYPDIAHVELVRDDTLPPDAKSGEAFVVGALLATLAQQPGALNVVVNTVRDWLSGHASRSVELRIGRDTLTVKGVSSRDQRRVIDAFLERHR